MEQRGVIEIDVRAMLERAGGFEPNVTTAARDHDAPTRPPMDVIVEPDVDAKLLVIVTVYEAE